MPHGVPGDATEYIMRANNSNRTIAVIGGGAAGLMAAAAAGHAGCHVLLFDRNDRLGRKIYATGNGRCNLTNYAMSDDYYNVDIMDRLYAFDSEALIHYYQNLGVYVHDRAGYVYPRTDQAATIAEALIRSLTAYPGVEIHSAEPVLSIAKSDRPQTPDTFRITTPKGAYDADRVVLAVGGQVSKIYGCTGDGYRMAEAFGHTVTVLSPALVPVYVDDPLCRIASGVRCAARVTAVIDGEEAASDTGELQVTDRGFSGIPVFQVSRWISQAIAQGHRAELVIDYLPEFNEELLRAEIARRQQDSAVIYVRDITAGLVHTKIGSLIARTAGLVDEQKLRKLENPAMVIEDLIRQLHCSNYTVTGTAGYDKAQVTAGGVPLDEMDNSFESRKTRGLYLAGEILDVDGMCGGYNLTWAMCSGHIAGVHASTDEYI